MSFPRNLIEFQDRFPDEESCWRHLREVRWPEGFDFPLIRLTRDAHFSLHVWSKKGGSWQVIASSTTPVASD